MSRPRFAPGIQNPNTVTIPGNETLALLLGDAVCSQRADVIRILQLNSPARFHIGGMTTLAVPREYTIRKRVRTSSAVSHNKSHQTKCIDKPRNASYHNHRSGGRMHDLSGTSVAYSSRWKCQNCRWPGRKHYYVTCHQHLPPATCPSC